MNVGTENWSLHLLLTLLLAVVSVTWASLFSEDDLVSQLQPNSFSSVIHNSPKMWIVDFYVSWCGYCQRMAPEFSDMAQSIKGWSGVVGVAAVECSDSANTELCRSYDVNGYPTIKFFPPNTETSFKGLLYEGDKYKAGLVAAILVYLKEFVAQGKTDQSWPKLDYVQHPQTLRANGVNDVYVVVEDESMSAASVGLEVILNSLGFQPEVVVGRMNMPGAELYGITTPGLYKSTLFGGLQLVARESSQQKLSKQLNLLVNVATDGLQVTSMPSIYSTKSFIFTLPQGLHMQDLESSLYYSFWVEIPSQRVFDEESLKTLKKYVELLNKYHPGEPHVKLFLNMVEQWLSTRSAPLTAKSWLQKLHSSQSNVAYIRESLRWTGCHGSTSYFRGYPCSLWMTFHAITVSAYVREINNTSFDPKEILIPIRNYVKTFFSCRPCSENFVKHAKHLESRSLSAHDAVLWLWKSHNRANFHLHGDVTEDRMHPKVQFPSFEACSECRVPSAADMRFNMTENMWIENNVLAYLLRYYGQSHIVNDDIEGMSSQPGFVQANKACQQRLDYLLLTAFFFIAKL